MAWIYIVKFLVSFIAIIFLLLYLANFAASIVNPQFVTDENGKVKDLVANRRAICGLITSIAWAILIALP